MVIKSEKTFEDIVERLIALFEPRDEKPDADGVPSQPSTSNPSKTHASIRFSSTTAEDQAE